MGRAASEIRKTSVHSRGEDERLYWQTGLMLAVARALRCPRWLRPLWLVGVFLLIGATVAGAASAVIADFDGDSQPDRAELSHREPSAVRIWLSTTRRTSIIRFSSAVVSVPFDHWSTRGCAPRSWFVRYQRSFL